MTIETKIPFLSENIKLWHREQSIKLITNFSKLKTNEVNMEISPNLMEFATRYLQF